MAGNDGLIKAGRNKKDEFYTQLADIEAEMKLYKSSYPVYQDYSYCTVSQTPFPDFSSTPFENSQSSCSKEQIKQKHAKQPRKLPEPKAEIVQRKAKKFWTTEQKAFAIAKSKVLGLSKTTKFLRKNYPVIYGDLSPSTLQYWMYKDKIDQHEKEKEE